MMGQLLGMKNGRKHVTCQQLALILPHSSSLTEPLTQKSAVHNQRSRGSIEREAHKKEC